MPAKNTSVRSRDWNWIFMNESKFEIYLGYVLCLLCRFYASFKEIQQKSHPVNMVATG